MKAASVRRAMMWALEGMRAFDGLFVLMAIFFIGVIFSAGILLKIWLDKPFKNKKSGAE